MFSSRCRPKIQSNKGRGLRREGGRGEDKDGPVHEHLHHTRTNAGNNKSNNNRKIYIYIYFKSHVGGGKRRGKPRHIHTMQLQGGCDCRGERLDSEKSKGNKRE